MLKYMIDLPPFPHSDDPIKNRYSKPVINALVNRGKKYLEDRLVNIFYFFYIYIAI